MFPSRFSHTRELRLHSLSLAHVDNVRELCGLEAPVLEHFELHILDSPSPVTFNNLLGHNSSKGSPRSYGPSSSPRSAPFGPLFRVHNYLS
jgi:hypothetical protein